MPQSSECFIVMKYLFNSHKTTDKVFLGEPVFLVLVHICLGCEHVPRVPAHSFQRTHTGLAVGYQSTGFLIEIEGMARAPH